MPMEMRVVRVCALLVVGVVALLAASAEAACMQPDPATLPFCGTRVDYKAYFQTGKEHFAHPHMADLAAQDVYEVMELSLTGLRGSTSQMAPAVSLLQTASESAPREKHASGGVADAAAKARRIAEALEEQVRFDRAQDKAVAMSMEGASPRDVGKYAVDAYLHPPKKMANNRGEVPDVTLEKSMDRPGGDYRVFQMATSDPEACQAECALDARCVAWTYAKPGIRAARAVCYLKQQIPRAVAGASCCVSGVRVSRITTSATGTLVASNHETHVRYTHKSYDCFAMHKNDVKACEDACMGQDECHAWTFTRAHKHRHSKPRCCLFRTLPAADERAKDGHCTSGHKVEGGAGGGVLQEATDMPGFDYATFPLDAEEPTLCQRRCVEDERCQAWTMRRAAFTADKQHAECALKTQVPAAVHLQECCVSGEKVTPGRGTEDEAAAIVGNSSPADDSADGLTFAALTMEPNVRRPGCDMGKFVLEEARPELCKQSCARTPECKAYTYAEPGIEGGQAVCHLKNNIPPVARRPYHGLITGVKLMYLPLAVRGGKSLAPLLADKQYMTERNALAVLKAPESRADKAMASLVLKDGLVDKTGVSLELMGDPGMYLVADGDSAKFVRDKGEGDMQFGKRATWQIIPGLVNNSNPDVVSLNSWANPALYLRARGNLMVLDEAKDTLAQKECTFFLRPPLVCKNECSRRGKCVKGKCECQAGFKGEDCSVSPGKALLFDGKDDYVDVPRSDSLSSFFGDYTVEAWVSVHEAKSGKFQPIFSQHTMDGRNNRKAVFVLWVMPSGRLQWLVGTGTDVWSVTTPKPLPSRQWVHVAAVMGRITGNLYVNGERVATRDIKQQRQHKGFAHLQIGRFNNGKQHLFRGMLDEMRVWNRARMQPQIQDTMRRKLDPKEKGLIAYWDTAVSLDKPGEELLMDRTPFKNDGQLGDSMERRKPQWVKLLDDDPMDPSSGAGTASILGDGSELKYAVKFGKEAMKEKRVLEGASAQGAGKFGAIDPPACLAALHDYLCAYSFRICDEHAQPRAVCRATCEDVNRKCHTQMKCGREFADAPCTSGAPVA